MDSKQVKLFNPDNTLVLDFDEVVDKILSQVHGIDYYDSDEPIENTNLMSLDRILLEDEKNNEEDLDKTMEIVTSMVTDDAPKINIVEANDKKVKFIDFVPLIVFILLFIGIMVGGYYLINSIDLSKLSKIIIVYQ